MIAAVKSHSPIRAALETAGIRLVRDKGLCPFHNDKTPSLSIKAVPIFGERWRCWGCGEGGDVIDFTAKFYGLDTKGAIKLLADRAGIRRANTQQERQAADKAQREREEKARLVKALRVWEQQEVNDISAILRKYRRLMASRTTFTEPELVDLARLQENIDILEYRYGILCRTDDKAKFELYMGAMSDARTL